MRKSFEVTPEDDLIHALFEVSGNFLLFKDQTLGTGRYVLHFKKHVNRLSGPGVDYVIRLCSNQGKDQIFQLHIKKKVNIESFVLFDKFYDLTVEHCMMFYDLGLRMYYTTDWEMFNTYDETLIKRQHTLNNIINE